VETDRLFGGSIPALYDQYLGPMIFSPYADDLAARLANLEHGCVLETAAGTGVVTRLAQIESRSLPKLCRTAAQKSPKWPADSDGEHRLSEENCACGKERHLSSAAAWRCCR
jgi:hypothetical protein